ncbi:MAG: 2-oxoacid:ferredoxin oxidoreductase subunit alpha [Acidilobaceae archaeon]
MVDLNLIIGGPQGGGVESAGQVVVKAIVLKGFNVLGTREYHSNIMGAHSYYHVRFSDGIVRALRLPVESIVALDAESVLTHINDLSERGFLVYDIDTLSQDATRIASMEPSLRRRLRNTFNSLGLNPTVANAIKILEEKGVKTIGLPLKDLLKKVSAEIGAPIASIAKTVNVIGIASSLYMLGFEPEYISKALELQFGNRPKILKPNITAASVAIEYIESNYGKRPILQDGPHKGKRRMITSGNEIVAMAKIIGGLSFETFYPITPASDEAFHIEENKYIEVEGVERDSIDKLSIVVLQTEDEISAINMAIGAALTGSRAATSTSGPGFSLMNEAISMAVEAEVPILISLWMRAGPSTGIATREGQQDLLHSIFSGHGDTPKIVIASGDHIEAFYDTLKAMNWAEEFQTPVIHLLDKYLASTITVLDEPEIDPSIVDIRRGKRVESPGDNYKRYEITEDGLSPMAPLGSTTMIVSSLEHDEYGFASEDPIDREEMMKKRIRKFETIAKSIPESEKLVLHGDIDARITIISFGSTKQAILGAIEELEKRGIKVNFLQFRILSPFPSSSALDVLSRSERIISVESNAMGQLSLLVRAHTGVNIEYSIRKLNARPLYDIDIVYGVERIIKDNVKSVVVSSGS